MNDWVAITLSVSALVSSVLMLILGISTHRRLRQQLRELEAEKRRWSE